MAGQVMREVGVWKDAIARGDTFRFAKTRGDRALIARIWQRLCDAGEDSLSADMLSLKDIERGINSLIEKAAKLDRLEIILNDVNQSERQTIERMSRLYS
jgi:hypothetical protein